MRISPRPSAPPSKFGAAQLQLLRFVLIAIIISVLLLCRTVVLPIASDSIVPSIPSSLLPQTHVVDDLLPPPLSNLPLSRRPVTSPGIHDWKRPAVLTIYADDDEDDARRAANLTLMVVTTGLCAKMFGWEFDVVACEVGGKQWPVWRKSWEVVECRVPENEVRGLVTVWVREDERMEGGSVKEGGEVFGVEDGDFEPVEGITGVVRVQRGLQWDSRFYEGRSQGEWKWEVCAMTAMRMYPWLIPGWVAYLRRIGVDRVFVYDNGIKRGALEEQEGMEVVGWEWGRSQMQGGTHFLRAGARRCRWVAFWDADEYWYGGGKWNGVRDWIRERTGEQVSVFWIEMGGGYGKRPAGSVVERYIKRRGGDGRRGKVMVEVGGKKRWANFRVHLVVDWEESGGRKEWRNETATKGGVVLVHYSRRSWEEWVIKQRTGGASVLTAGRPAKVGWSGGDGDRREGDEGVEEWINEGNRGSVWSEFRDWWRKVMRREESQTWVTRQDEDGNGWCRGWVGTDGAVNDISCGHR